MLGFVVRTFVLNVFGFGVHVSGVRLWIKRRDGEGSGSAEMGNLATFDMMVKSEGKELANS